MGVAIGPMVAHTVAVEALPGFVSACEKTAMMHYVPSFGRD